MNKIKKSFTLVELMVVVAVIAILATALLIGLGGARKKARDAKRLSSVKEIQNVLELYYAKEGNYPSGGYSNLKTELASEGIISNENQLPTDPLGTAEYKYIYNNCNNGQDYVIGTHLEVPSDKIMSKSVKSTECSNPGDGDDLSACGSNGWYCVYY